MSPGQTSGTLRASDLAFAALAEVYVRAEPDGAAGVVRSVAARIPMPERWIATPARKARLARARLLHPERVAAELARSDVALLGGWVVSRSEADYAIYLHSLTRA